MSEALAHGLEQVLGRRVGSLRAIPGGDLNDAYRASFADGGPEVFVKTRADAVPGSYVAEAAGLEWIGSVDGGCPTPAVLGVGDRDPGEGPEWRGPRFLALEWVAEGRLDAAGEEALGRALACVHRAGAPAWGAGAVPGAGSATLHIGPLTFEDTARDGEGWASFYARCRVLPLARRAADSGALPDATVALLSRVCDRLGELAGPPEPPARLHGDLWSGNVHAGADGRPWLIDPAAYGGHREVDCAMLQLFGGPGPRAFAAYDEVFPRADGADERVPLWQLFPLLVHAVLFGGGYGTSVTRIARRFA